MKVIITNLSGNVGKTTLRKHLFAPLLPDAQVISVEDLNDGDGPVRTEYAARDFRALAVELNVADEASNYVVDIGSSNLREALAQFKSLRSTRQLIDFWVLPCPPNLKQRNDTVNSIRLLIDLGVRPDQIRVLQTMVEDVHAAQSIFEPLIEKAGEVGYEVCDVPVFTNDVFQMLKDKPSSVFDVASSPVDYRALIRSRTHSKAELEDIGRAMVALDLARGACDNLRQVFAHLNLQQAITA
jgi:cellulose biosynthesis protein BcsQ